MTADRPHVIPAEDGILPGVLDLHYHRWDAVSQSRLKLLERSPAHFKAALDDPAPVSRPRQENFDLGSAVHMAVLQLDDFERWFRLRPPGRANSNGYRAAEAAIRAENPFIRMLKPAHWDLVPRIRDAVLANADARAIIEGASCELSGVWTDECGVRAKCRLDALNPGIGVLADLKTCVDARPAAFGRQVDDLRYYRQAAFYLRGAAALGRPERDWVFIAVEKDPPYGVWVHELAPHWLGLGEDEVDGLLARYVACAGADDWPGYPAGVRRLHPTGWQEQAAQARAEQLARQQGEAT